MSYILLESTETEKLQKAHLQGALSFTTPVHKTKSVMSHQHCITVCLASLHCPPLKKFFTDGTVTTTVHFFPVETNNSSRSREYFSTLRPKYFRCYSLELVNINSYCIPHAGQVRNRKTIIEQFGCIGALKIQK